MKRSANASDNIRKRGEKIQDDTTKSKQIDSRPLFYVRKVMKIRLDAICRESKIARWHI